MIDLSAHRARLRAFAWLLVAVGAILYCRHYWDEAPGLSLYIEAARCMLDGLPLQQCNPTFTYPPIVALMTIPLVPLPQVLQNFIWYLLTLASLVGCFALSARLARRLMPGEWSENDLAWLYGIALLFSAKFMFAAIGNQSYDASVVLLVLIGLTGLTGDGADRSPLWAGASLACAAALKATPLLFLPYLVIKGHFRAALAMAVVVAALSILPDLVFTIGREGDGYFMAWLHQVASPALTEKMAGNPHTFWYGSNPNNNSLRGLVGVFYDDDDPNSGFKAALYAVYLVYAAIVAILILRTRKSRAALTTDGALLLISMLMLSPMSSQSHYVAIIPAICALVATWRKGEPAMRRVAAFFLVANLVLTNATSKDLVGQTVTFWAKQHRLLVSDALLFLVFFATLVFRPQHDGAKSGMPTALGQSVS